MKLKQLHLRNIASIEEADIDFEHDLNGADGTPASVFLISGDTGVGKTVILDCITLALYKTTPRINSVINPMGNLYKSNDGELLSINSIVQYTRLGISHKSPCYSEVVFEGNDGIEYHARLELGLNRNGGHRDPKWTVKIGSADWVRVDNRNSQIQQAIGLSFQQFNRMAMLAQGQFASFLCGDKREREEILEQLTNTEIFSLYGNAIKNIFDRTKKDYEIADKALETEAAHLLSTERVDELTNLQNHGQTLAQELAAKIDGLEQQILILTRLIDNQQKACSAQSRLDELNQHIASDEYSSQKRLIEEWDSTEKERPLAELRQHTADDITLTTAKIERCRQRFAVLSSDLLWRQSEFSATAQNLSQQKAWLDQQQRDIEVLTHANEIILRIDYYSAKLRELDDKRSSKTLAEKQTPSLEKALSDATDHHADSQHKCLAMQQSLEKLSNQLTALDASNIASQLESLSKKRQQLQQWSQRLRQLTTLRQEADTLQTDISSADSLLKDRAVQRDTLAQAQAEARKRHDEAQSRYTTMSSSVDDTLRNLRAQLASNNADTCPLCGQHLSHILHDDDFHQLLAPLNQERSQAAIALQQATAQAQEADTLYNQLHGQQEMRQQQLSKMLLAIQHDDEALRQELSRSGIDCQGDINAQLVELSASIENQSAMLHERQTEIEFLMKQTTQLLDEKKSADKALTVATNQLHKANLDLTTNKNTIESLSQQILQAKQETAQHCRILSDTLGTILPDWQSDLPKTRSILQSRAGEYSIRLDTYNKGMSAHLAEQELLRQMGEIQASQVFRDVNDKGITEWRDTVIADNNQCKPLPQPATLTDWNTLASATGTLQLQLATLTETLTNADRQIKAWEAQSGKDGSYLLYILGQRAAVDSARLHIADVAANLKSAHDALSAATQSITEATTALPADTATDNPQTALQLLQESKAQLDSQRQQALVAYAEAKRLLDTDAENHRLADAARERCLQAQQRYRQWMLINQHFGGTRFRTLVQTHILRPLLANANIYLERITDRYRLTCSEENEKLSILVHDRYNKDAIRSATVLSGGERFMVSLALSLALSSLGRPDLNVDILFIDEGFGTLDEKSLDNVMSTLERLQTTSHQTGRRVGIISHREELLERIPTQIHIRRHGEGRSLVSLK